MLLVLFAILCVVAIVGGAWVHPLLWLFLVLAVVALVADRARI